MKANRLIGIDVGTTSVKAAILDTHGQVLEQFVEGYQITRTGDHIVEQNPNDWWTYICQATKRILNESKIPKTSGYRKIENLIINGLIVESGKVLSESKRISKYRIRYCKKRSRKRCNRACKKN